MSGWVRGCGRAGGDGRGSGRATYAWTLAESGAGRTIWMLRRVCPESVRARMHGILVRSRLDLADSPLAVLTCLVVSHRPEA